MKRISMERRSDTEGLRLESRLRILLPETYDVFDDAVQPVSMGSAGLKIGADGKVLWQQMWGSFCDLAMAGGPPHRGRLLEPVYCAAGADQPATSVASAEICRGVSLVTGLCAEPSPHPGWIWMYCTSAAMADWLRRAIVMENVSAARHGLALSLPTGSTFRIDKEIKNVITSVAKTCHYWRDHMSAAKHQDIATLLATMEREAPLVSPGCTSDNVPEGDAAIANRMAHEIYKLTGLEPVAHPYTQWLGLDCRNVHAAIWIMRALAASNVLSRREANAVFFPFSIESAGARAHTIRAVDAAFHHDNIGRLLA